MPAGRDFSVIAVQFQPALERVTILRRYKRFLADVRFADGRELTVHCANPGSMLTCIGAGWPGLVSRSANPKRELAYSLEFTHNGRAWIGVNPVLANRLFEEAWLSSRGALFEEISDYQELRREVQAGGSRLDFELSSGTERRSCLVEIKSVSMAKSGRALFPDSPTDRGRKHLRELMRLAQERRRRAALVFVVQRRDVSHFEAARSIDPEYATLLGQAPQAGVALIAVRVRKRANSLKIEDRLPIRLP